MNSSGHSVSKYPPGSLREYWSVFFPLLVASAGNYIVFMVDRIIIGKYSFAAMKAVGLFSVIYYFFLYPLFSVALKVNVVVGQYYGSSEFSKMGRVPWQSFWLCCATLLFFIPFALYGVPWLVPESYHHEALIYAQLITLSIPLSGCFFSFSGFFLGHGKATLVFFITLLGNIINLVLDYILVLGVYVPPLGAAGAAIATWVALIVQTLVVLSFMLSAHNRNLYATHRYAYSPAIFSLFFKYAWPGAIANFLGYFAVALFVYILHFFAEDYFAAFNIVYSIYLISFGFSFSVLSTSQLLTANYIGSQQFHLVHKVFRSSVAIIGCYTICFAIPFLCFPETLTHWFTLNDSTLTLSKEEFLIPNVTLGLHLMLLTLFFDSYFMSIVGILVAAADLIIPLMINLAGQWLILPVALFLMLSLTKITPNVVYVLLLANCLILSLSMLYRFKSNRWKTLCRLT